MVLLLEGIPILEDMYQLGNLDQLKAYRRKRSNLGY
jgi:hypothetical protein